MDIAPNVQAIIASADPDGLLSESLLSQALVERGFELLFYEDSVTFRFAFESRFRSRLDGRGRINLIVIANGDESVLNTLPFDILAKAKTISLSLANIFPTLSYPVLRDLEPQYVDQLYEAQIRFNPGVLGENATKDFILRHIFEIAAELIKSDADLIRTLLRRHYRVQSIPHPLVDRLEHVLSESGRFTGWPITALFEERSLFYRFLQERWPIFLDKRIGTVTDSDLALSVSGPIDIPFDDPDVRVYIDNLFVEGLLRPIEWTGVPEAWALAGIRNDPESTRVRHFEALLDIAEREMPGSEARHGDWLSFARIWAEVNLHSSDIGTSNSRAMLDRLTVSELESTPVFASGFKSELATSPVSQQARL